MDSFSLARDGAFLVLRAGHYLNKLNNERIERECRRHIEDGATRIIIDFSETEIVNSVGVSILLGLIDIAANSSAEVTLSGVNDTMLELFDALGLTQHVKIA